MFIFEVFLKLIHVFPTTVFTHPALRNFETTTKPWVILFARVFFVAFRCVGENDQRITIPSLSRPVINNMAASEEASDICVIVKWSGKEYPIEHLSPSETVRYLKDLIKEKTGVLPERQKLLGLKFKGI